MPAPSAVSAREPVPVQHALTARQRWIAAQRLAAGDTPGQVAVLLGTTGHVLEVMQATDPDFRDAIAAERRVLALSSAARRERLLVMIRQAFEREIAGGRISIVNLAVRLTGLLDKVWEPLPSTAPSGRPSRGVMDLPESLLLACLGLDQGGHGPRDAGPAPVDASSSCSRMADEPPKRPWYLEDEGEERQFEDSGDGRPDPPASAPGHDGPSHGTARDDAAGAETGEAGLPAAEAPPAPGPVAALRVRIRRLLASAAARTPEEVDLAEAVCAALVPRWPAYRGAIDPWDLRNAVRGVSIDSATLNRLASPAFTAGAGPPGAPPVAGRPSSAPDDLPGPALRDAAPVEWPFAAPDDPGRSGVPQVEKVDGVPAGPPLPHMPAPLPFDVLARTGGQGRWPKGP